MSGVQTSFQECGVGTMSSRTASTEGCGCALWKQANNTRPKEKMSAGVPPRLVSNSCSGARNASPYYIIHVLVSKKDTEKTMRERWSENDAPANRLKLS